jgi:hypothetical protein
VHEFQLAAPYAAAILVYLLGPTFSRLARHSISGAIDNARVTSGLPDEKAVPYYLASGMILDYVEYATDLAQVVPVILLPIIGALYSFSSIPVPVAVSILVVVFLIAIGMLGQMVTRLPAKYVSRKWHGFPVLTLAGIALNLVAMALTLSLS